MNDIIKINEMPLNGELKQTVNARELHAFLEVGKDFSTWLKKRLNQFGFVKNEDYIVLPQTGENPENPGLGGRPSIEYYLTLDMAKELAMVERNQKGKQARQYFIACEKKLKEQAQFAIPQTYPEALRLAAAAVEDRNQLARQVNDMKPKAAFHDNVAIAINAQSVSDVAKILGLGRNRLFSLLKEKAILMVNNIPYQQYLSKGYFRVIEKQYSDNNGECYTYTQSLITGKGLIFIQKLLHSHANAAI